MGVILDGYCKDCRYFDQERIMGSLKCSHEKICERAYTWGTIDGSKKIKDKIYISLFSNPGPGLKGPNPKECGMETPYYHIAYANSADGHKDFSTHDCSNRIFVGSYSDTCPTDSENPLRYTWTCVMGEKGTSIGDPIGPDES